MAAEQRPLTGTIIDRRYRVDELVASGGFGEVYAAWHLLLGAKVALKRLRLEDDLPAEKRGERIAEFLGEARTLTKLRHPNVVSAIDVGLVEGSEGASQIAYMVMEWCDGVTLKDRLASAGRLGVEEAAAILERVTDALAHAHRLGVVHRDIKPSNIMLALDPDGREAPRVIDFGIAKLLHPAERAGTGSTLTDSKYSPHTPGYAAPEQVAGGRTGPWTDVHALGLLFVEMVSGEPPYGRDGYPGLAAVDPVRPSLPAANAAARPFDAMVARALALRPAERFADAGELHAVIVDRAASRPISSSPEGSARTDSAPSREGPSSPPSGRTVLSTSQPAKRADPRPSATRGRKLAVLGMGVAMAGAFVGALVALRPRKDVPLRAFTNEAPSAPVLSGSAPSLAAGSTAKAPGPCDVPIDKWRERITALGLTPDSLSDFPTLPMITGSWAEDGKEFSFDITRITSLPTNAADKKRELLRRVGYAVAADQSEGKIYGLQGECRVFLRGPSSPLTISRFDALTKGFPLDTRGDTMGGPNPAAAALAPPPDVRVAKRISEISSDEFESRVGATNEPVRQRSRFEGATQVVLQQTPERYATVTIFHDKGDATPEALGKSVPPGSVGFYADDGKVRVVLSGVPPLASNALLERILEGLGAQVERLP